MKKIFIVGDSISIQYGPFLVKYLQGIMLYSRKEGTEEALQNLDIPQGANGGDSSMIVAYLKSKQHNGGINADYLLVNCGLHDIKTNPETGIKQVSIEEYKENLSQIILLAKIMKLQLIWINTTPCDEAVHNHKKIKFHRFAGDVIAYNKTAEKIMADADVSIIDLYDFTMNLGAKEIYCDHVHFIEPVREKHAAFIAGYLNALSLYAIPI
jgi:hypothetical protein